MFLDLTIGLMFFSLAAELLLAYKIPFWHNLAEKSVLVAFIASLALSYVFGKAFGANGMIVMIAALGSTVLAVPCYKGVAWYRTADRGKFAQDLESAKQLARDTWRVIYLCLRVITFPIWAYRDIKGWFARQRKTLSRS